MTPLKISIDKRNQDARPILQNNFQQLSPHHQTRQTWPNQQPKRLRVSRHSEERMIYNLTDLSPLPAPSLHSRAARRATSPSINTDKSLKDVQLPSESLNQRPAVLGLHQNAGVTKKSKRGRKSVLSTRARARHERGLEKAEAIVDRTATKVQKSKYSASKVETRKKTWDEINSAAGKVGKKGNNMFAGLEDQEEEDDEEEEDKKNGWVDVKELDDEMAEAEPVVAANKTGASSSSFSAPAAPPPVDEDEDIL